ncbi:ribbon-helix-helix domain-containing protein [Paremcibacter congregatus]|uniref:ribbon-helix-helix domain-containing protein n=1 Tax=Paremcibacter congregatus TaxID=2043170 RepID=UPI0030EF66AC|tara:strand:+ start:3126 stop:3371 length:246 start_codon:yes stop_codon:yes gene_type:complete
MATERLTVSLAPDLRHWIDSAIETGGYSSASDFVATLVRNHRRGEQLDHLLTEGLASGLGVTPDADYWADKKAALAQKISS